MTDQEQSAAKSEIKFGYLADSRLLRAADVPRIVELNQEAYGGHRPMDPQRLLTSLENPIVDDTPRRCVVERDGVIVGYGRLLAAGGEVILEVVAPGAWAPFLEWAEATA